MENLKKGSQDIATIRNRYRLPGWTLMIDKGTKGPPGKRPLPLIKVDGWGGTRPVERAVLLYLDQILRLSYKPRIEQKNIPVCKRDDRGL